MSLVPTSEIADRLNALAPSLAPELLPNGHKSGNYWMASGIADTGRSASLWVSLAGANIGHWRDEGNCAAGEEHGDMLDLLRLTLGLADQREAVGEAKRRLGIEDGFTPGEPRRESPEAAEKRAAEARARAEKRAAEEAREFARKAKRAHALWLGAKPLAGSPAEAYLLARGIEPVPGEKPWPGSLRFEPRCWYQPSRAKLPAMVAPIVNAAGEQIGAHRTYLQCAPGRGWTKIDAADAKKVDGNKRGGFIPIAKGASGVSMRRMPEGEAVYLTEGIEDALVVRMMKPEARVVAAIDLGNIGALALPEAAHRLVIVADRDECRREEAKLERSIAQQQARGLEVQLVLPPAEVCGRRVKDINDWWLALQRGEAA